MNKSLDQEKKNNEFNEQKIGTLETIIKNLNVKEFWYTSILRNIPD